MLLINFFLQAKKKSRGLIIDAKHERLEQPDRGYLVNNSKRQQSQTSNNKTPHQYLKNGRKREINVV